MLQGTEPYIVGGHTASGFWVDTDRAKRETTIQHRIETIFERSNYTTILDVLPASRSKSHAASSMSVTKDLLTNVDASINTFSMDPKEQLKALKESKRQDCHPESPSRPSEEDKRLAFDRTAES